MSHKYSGCVYDTNLIERIDSQLVMQLKKSSYWRQVLKRTVVTVKLPEEWDLSSAVMLSYSL